LVTNIKKALFELSKHLEKISQKLILMAK